LLFFECNLYRYAKDVVPAGVLTPPSVGGGEPYPLQPQRDSAFASSAAAHHRYGDDGGGGRDGGGQVMKKNGGGGDGGGGGGGGVRYDFGGALEGMEDLNLGGYNYGYPAPEPEIASIASKIAAAAVAGGCTS
jgi:hypothetical protein